MNKIKVFYLVLKNSTTELKELPVDLVQSITPRIDAHGNSCLVISYYDNEFCCMNTLICDSIESVRTEE